MRQIIFIFLAFVFTGQAVADERRQILDTATTASPEVAAEIESAVLQWAEYWNTSRWTQIHTMWDPDEAAPTYLGEERDRWLIGPSGLRSYFRPPEVARSMVGKVWMYPYRLRVRSLSDNIVVAIWDMRLDFSMKNRPPINDNFRVNAVFRKKPEGWMFIHYAEAPLSPLIYVEHLYRKSVTPNFEEVAMPMESSE